MSDEEDATLVDAKFFMKKRSGGDNTLSAEDTAALSSLDDGGSSSSRAGSGMKRGVSDESDESRDVVLGSGLISRAASGSDGSPLSSFRFVPRNDDHVPRLAARQSSEILRQRMNRVLTDGEKKLLQSLAEEIFKLQSTPTGWMGNFVTSILRAVGNPSLHDLRQIVVPYAQEILRSAQSTLQKRHALGIRSKEPPLSLEDAIHAAVRFLLADNFAECNQVLRLAMEFFPHDLRFYKMFASSALLDRTLNYRTQRMESALEAMGGVRHPDAEIWALRGTVCRELWRMDKGQRFLAEHAINCYLKSYEHSTKEKNPNTDSVAFGLVRSALMSVALYTEELRSGGTHRGVSMVYKEQAIEHLNALNVSLQQWQERYPTITSSRYFYFNLTFARLGLRMYELARESAQMFIEAVKDEQAMVDSMSERSHRKDLANFVRIIAFSGVPLPSETEPKQSWHMAWQIVRDIFAAKKVQITRDVLTSSYRGKLGLSLSGGGMRAAYLHLGTLARLAECGILQHVESLSCVSGGSIVGSIFYQQIKELLESKSDDEITREDYIVVVNTIIFRMTRKLDVDMSAKMLANPWTNLRIAFGGSVRRVQIVAQIFHERVITPFRGQGGVQNQLKMRDLVIRPKNWNSDIEFQTRMHNWRRSCKVPALYINCTNISTGHLWRFTVKYLGENAEMAGGDVGVDNNSILESIPYEEILDEETSNISLPLCVSISALYPGILDPYVINGLYPGFRVNLVDGGVYDNAGLQSLYHSRADYIIANDMASYLGDALDISRSPVAVLQRVLQIAVSLQYERLFRELKDRTAGHGLKDVCLIHLRQDDLHHTSVARMPSKAELVNRLDRQGTDSRSEIEESLRHPISDARYHSELAARFHRRVPAVAKDFSAKAELSAYFAETQRLHLKKAIQLREKTRRRMRAKAAADRDREARALKSQYEQMRKDVERSSAEANARSKGSVSRLDTEKQLQMLEEEYRQEHQAIIRKFKEREMSRNAHVKEINDPHLHMGHFLRSAVLDFRSAPDRCTEVEMYALMATGYHLTDHALKTCQSSRYAASQLLPNLLTFGEREDMKKSDEDLSAELSAAGLDDPHGTWAFFDVHSEPTEWVFTDTLKIMESASDHHIPAPEFDPFDPQQKVQLPRDPHKTAKVLRTSPDFDVSHCTDNPALVELYNQLEIGSSGLSMTRAFRRSPLLSYTFLLFWLGLLAVGLYFAVESYLDFLDNDNLRTCFCGFEEPLYYVIILFALYFLLVSPGWLRKALWACVLLPTYAFWALNVFDPFLMRRGQVKPIVDLHKQYLVANPGKRLDKAARRQGKTRIATRASQFRAKGENFLTNMLQES